MTAESSSELWNRALRLLTRREHSVLELRQKLQRKGYEAEQVDPVLERLVAEGLLNEHRFAESFTRLRVERGLGPHRIRRELRERGIGERDIEGAMAPFGDTWIERAIAAREKKFGTEPVEAFREQARQQRFLQYRGFTHEQIRAAVETILS